MNEIYKDIIGYEGFYQISNMGRVKSLEKKVGNGRLQKEKLLKLNMDVKDYMYVKLCKYGIPKTIRVHRLVALHFIENLENKLEINHINGIKKDNCWLNLEWCSGSENVIHAFKLGLRKPPNGNNGNSTKLTKEQTITVKELKVQGFSQTHIAKLFGVTQSTISNIILNKRWKNI